MFKNLLLSVLIIAALAAPTMARTLDRIAAVVNDDIITTHQLKQRLLEAKADSNSRDQQRHMLDVMIDELLMKQRAQDIGIEVSAKDIDQAVADVEKKNNINRQQLEQALVAQGMTMEAYRKQLSAQIMRYKLIGHEVQSKVDITRQEIRNYYQQHLNDYKQSAHSRISRISFPVGDDREQARHNAEIALRKLDEGKSVDAILEELSGRTRIEGGDMGDFKPGELSPAFEQAITGLASGAHSGIIEFGGAFHILKVENKTSGGVADLASIEDKISRQLRKEKLDKKLAAWRKKLKKEAYIDIRL